MNQERAERPSPKFSTIRSGCRVAATHMSFLLKSGHMSTQVQLLPPGPFLFALDLRRGSSVGQYERLITSKRRCKSCPRNQFFWVLQ